MEHKGEVANKLWIINKSKEELEKIAVYAHGVGEYVGEGNLSKLAISAGTAVGKMKQRNKHKLFEEIGN